MLVISVRIVINRVKTVRVSNQHLKNPVNKKVKNLFLNGPLFDI